MRRDEEYEGNLSEMRMGVKGEGKETEAEIDGQCKCGLKEEGTAG